MPVTGQHYPASPAGEPSHDPRELIDHMPTESRAYGLPFVGACVSLTVGIVLLVIGQTFYALLMTTPFAAFLYAGLWTPTGQRRTANHSSEQIEPAPPTSPMRRTMLFGAFGLSGVFMTGSAVFCLAFLSVGQPVTLDWPQSVLLCLAGLYHIWRAVRLMAR